MPQKRAVYGQADPESTPVDASLNGAFNLIFPAPMATCPPVAMSKFPPVLVYHVAFLSIATVNFIS